MKHEQKHQNRPLPFPEWMEQTYPEKTAKRSFLKMIGALDLAYLMYRMGTKGKEGIEEIEGKEETKKSLLIPQMPLVVENYKKPKTEKKTPIKKKSTSPSKPTKPKTKRSPKSQPSMVAEIEHDLKLELTHEPEPVITPKAEPQPVAEPEPLELVTEAIIEEPVKTPRHTHGHDLWLDDESLEDTDLRKSRTELKKGATTLSFDVQDIDDEQETQILINGTAWRVMLPSPSMNLSRMAQIVRVSYREIYVLGRAALGAMSGEGYVSADEVTRIADTLATADKKTVELDVQYHDKDMTSKKRTTSTVRIRFEQV